MSLGFKRVESRSLNMSMSRAEMYTEMVKEHAKFWRPPIALQAAEPIRVLRDRAYTPPLTSVDHNATLHLVCWTMLLSFTMAAGLSQWWNLPAVSSLDRVFWLACAYVATRAATSMK